jgi:hypothetical protein
VFSQLPGLQNIRISWVRQIDSIHGYWLRELTAAVKHLAPLVTSSGHAGVLRELSTFSELFLEIPPECFRSLICLDVWSPTRMDVVLETAVANAPQLESLSLACMDFDDIVCVLKTKLDAWPRLRAFKLIALDPVANDGSVDVLVDFFRNKPDLRRLDTNLPGLSTEAFRTLFHCIRGMRHLEILGIDARCIVEPDDMEEFAMSLPPNLMALHIQSCWENLPVDAVELFPLVCRGLSLAALR